MKTQYGRRLHLANCEYCGKRIAWSRRRRQWLALAPLMSAGMTHIARRLMCQSAPRGGFHDPVALLPWWQTSLGAKPIQGGSQ